MICEIAFAAIVTCSEPAISIDVDSGVSHVFVEKAFAAGYHGVPFDGSDTTIYVPYNWARTNCVTDTDCGMVDS